MQTSTNACWGKFLSFRQKVEVYLSEPSNRVNGAICCPGLLKVLFFMSMFI